MKDTKNERFRAETEFDVEDNLADSAVIISDTKARLIYKEFIEKRNDLALFSLFVSIFVSTLLAIFTASFKDLFGIPYSSYMVLGAFVVVCVLSLIFAILFFILWLANRKKYDENRFIQELHQKGKDPEKELVQ